MEVLGERVRTARRAKPTKALRVLADVAVSESINRGPLPRVRPLTATLLTTTFHVSARGRSLIMTAGSNEDDGPVDPLEVMSVLPNT